MESLRAGKLDIPVVFENGECVVLNKPAGLAVQGGAGLGCSLDRVLADRWSPRPLLVHRLDRDTSGLILTARGREAAARFSRLFARAGTGGVTKRYLALCRGRPPRREGRITASLEFRGGAKPAETFYKILSSSGDFSLLELTLGTGRTHQIRRHLAFTGNPVLGDDKYGDFPLNHRLRGEIGLKNLLLHASYLAVPGLPAFKAPLPDYFSPFLELFSAIL
jgi:23S rRNA pseudouridine955/2504/2580 synthase